MERSRFFELFRHCAFCSCREDRAHGADASRPAQQCRYNPTSCCGCVLQDLLHEYHHAHAT
eukprot:5178965-Amphidinium_carterae.1